MPYFQIAHAGRRNENRRLGLQCVILMLGFFIFYYLHAHYNTSTRVSSQSLTGARLSLRRSRPMLLILYDARWRHFKGRLVTALPRFPIVVISSMFCLQDSSEEYDDWGEKEIKGALISEYFLMQYYITYCREILLTPSIHYQVYDREGRHYAYLLYISAVKLIYILHDANYLEKQSLLRYLSKIFSGFKSTCDDWAMRIYARDDIFENADITTNDATIISMPTNTPQRKFMRFIKRDIEESTLCAALLHIPQSEGAGEASAPRLMPSPIPPRDYNIYLISPGIASLSTRTPQPVSKVPARNTLHCSLCRDILYYRFIFPRQPPESATRSRLFRLLCISKSCRAEMASFKIRHWCTSFRSSFRFSPIVAPLSFLSRNYQGSRVINIFQINIFEMSRLNIYWRCRK